MYVYVCLSLGDNDLVSTIGIGGGAGSAILIIIVMVSIIIYFIKWSKKNKKKVRTNVMHKVESPNKNTVFVNDDDDDDDNDDNMNIINLNSINATSSFIINNPILDRSFTQSSKG